VNDVEVETRLRCRQDKERVRSPDAYVSLVCDDAPEVPCHTHPSKTVEDLEAFGVVHHVLGMAHFCHLNEQLGVVHIDHRNRAQVPHSKSTPSQNHVEYARGEPQAVVEEDFACDSHRAHDVAEGQHGDHVAVELKPSDDLVLKVGLQGCHKSDHPSSLSASNIHLDMSGHLWMSGDGNHGQNAHDRVKADRNRDHHYAIE